MRDIVCLHDHWPSLPRDPPRDPPPSALATHRCCIYCVVRLAETQRAQLPDYVEGRSCSLHQAGSHLATPPPLIECPNCRHYFCPECIPGVSDVSALVLAPDPLRPSPPSSSDRVCPGCSLARPVGQEFRHLPCRACNSLVCGPCVEAEESARRNSRTVRNEDHCPFAEEPWHAAVLELEREWGWPPSSWEGFAEGRLCEERFHLPVTRLLTIFDLLVGPLGTGYLRDDNAARIRAKMSSGELSEDMVRLALATIAVESPMRAAALRSMIFPPRLPPFAELRQRGGLLHSASFSITFRFVNEEGADNNCLLEAALRQLGQGRLRLGDRQPADLLPAPLPGPADLRRLVAEDLERRRSAGQLDAFFARPVQHIRDVRSNSSLTECDVRSLANVTGASIILCVLAEEQFQDPTIPFLLREHETVHPESGRVQRPRTALEPFPPPPPVLFIFCAGNHFMSLLPLDANDPGPGAELAGDWCQCGEWPCACMDLSRDNGHAAGSSVALDDPPSPFEDRPETRPPRSHSRTDPPRAAPLSFRGHHRPRCPISLGPSTPASSRTTATTTHSPTLARGGSRIDT